MKLEIVVYASIGIAVLSILLGLLLRKGAPKLAAPPSEAITTSESREPDMSNSGKKKTTAQDIDRFLEEINRRKQQQKGAPAPPPPVQRQPERSKPVVVASPGKPVRVVQPSFPVVQAELIDEPAEKAYGVEKLSNTTNVSYTSNTPISQKLPKNAGAIVINVPAFVPLRELSPAMVALQNMIKDKNQLRAAFIFNEIMAGPRSKRRS